MALHSSHRVKELLGCHGGCPSSTDTEASITGCRSNMNATEVLELTSFFAVRGTQLLAQEDVLITAPATKAL